MPTSKTVLVAGATGRLGLLADVLLQRGHGVRAMTREPGSPEARRLQQLGAELVHGDFDDPGSIELAARGADAVFATGTAHRAGPEGELRHGHSVADAAAAAGVPHLVYSSGDGAAPDSPLPLFRAKAAVEHHIASLGIPHTILAPVYFMENLFNPWNLPALRSGLLPTPIPPDVPMQQVAVADLVAVAAIAIERPDEFAGERIAIASDELTAQDAAAAISDKIGVELEPRQAPADQLPPALGALFGWLEHVGHSVDVDSLHTRLADAGWHRYADWVESVRTRFRELCPDRGVLRA
jgi:uncharacterized protein YbjT (DUF2867 family)